MLYALVHVTQVIRLPYDRHGLKIQEEQYLSNAGRTEYLQWSCPIANANLRFSLLIEKKMVQICSVIHVGQNRQTSCLPTSPTSTGKDRHSVLSHNISRQYGEVVMPGRHKLHRTCRSFGTCREALTTCCWYFKAC